MSNYYKDSNTRGTAWLATALCVLLVVCVAWLAITPRVRAITMERYTLRAQVVEANSDRVLLCDDAGNLWKMTEMNNLRAGDSVDLLMSDSGTAQTEDDTIVACAKAAMMN